MTVKRVTKAQIITTDDQHFWKKDGCAVGGKTWCKRIFPMTSESAKTIEKSRLQHEEARQKRKLIFRIKRCNLKYLSLDQLTQIAVVIEDFEKCTEADVNSGASG